MGGGVSDYGLPVGAGSLKVEEAAAPRPSGVLERAGGTPARPIWQRRVLMGVKCQLPRFSGMILYDERGRPVCGGVRDRARDQEMEESRSGVCEVEKVPGIEVHGDESDDSSTGLGDESLSPSENIFVDSRSDNALSSEHVREAYINMDIDNDNERNISEVAFEENSNEVHGV
ncbi:hypothetical protein ACQ4PT_028644 [Festuca glaucescens]